MGPDEPIERWTAKRRAALVLRVLKGETSVVEAARQHGLTVAEVDGWQDQFLRAGLSSFLCNWYWLVSCWHPVS